MSEHLAPQLRIAVCDDEPIDRQQAAGLTHEITKEEGLACSLSCYESGAALLAAIQAGAHFFNRKMALRGYEVSAARYLAKPLQRPQLREALLHCCRALHEGRGILLPTEKGQSRLAPADIIYAEPWERGSKLQLVSGSIRTSAKFSDLMELLPEPSFTLCHRTILVNLAFVKHLRSHEIELADGRVLPVSKHRISDLKRQLLEYVHD